MGFCVFEGMRFLSTLGKGFAKGWEEGGVIEIANRGDLYGIATDEDGSARGLSRFRILGYLGMLET